MGQLDKTKIKLKEINNMPLGEIESRMLEKIIQDTLKTTSTSKIIKTLSPFAKKYEKDFPDNDYSTIIRSLKGEISDENRGKSALRACQEFRDGNLNQYFKAKEFLPTTDTFPSGLKIHPWHDYAANALYYDRCARVIARRFNLDYQDTNFPEEFHREELISQEGFFKTGVLNIAKKEIQVFDPSHWIWKPFRSKES